MDVVDPTIIAAMVDPPRAELEITAPEELLYFQGHFPQQAVLPGVVQVHWAVQLAEQYLGPQSTFKGIEGLKFHRIIEPDTTLHLLLEWSDENGKLHFRYASDVGVHSQGRILFE